jgi:cysteine synthase A
MMRFLGAKVVLTPAWQKGSGMVAKAAELARTHGWFLPRQFDNEANARIHERTTGPEILADFADRPLTHWVTGSGTGGTLLGVGRALRRASRDTRIVVCEPDNAPVLRSGVPMPPTAPDGSAVSHPHFRPHLMQGWSPDFIPSLVQRAVDEGLIDHVEPVPGAAALQAATDLARLEGIFAGISSGATVAGAIALAARLPAGSRLLAMLPDTGERYLSTPLFAAIDANMNEEEWEISRSSPAGRFDIAPPPAVPTPRPTPTPEGETLLTSALNDTANPVVMFALEWCEFSWAVRRFFQRLGVPYRSIDLDSIEWQEGDRGGQVRVALHAHLGRPTIPQIFVGGENVGGCTDTFDAWRSGQLQAALERCGVPYREGVVSDPGTFLPSWIQATSESG